MRSVALLLTASLTLAAGCAGPGVLRPLPDPVFGSSQQAAVPTARSVPQPEPPPRPTPSGGRIGSVTIVVDAGHGGKDPGARGVSALPEKSVNLGVAMKLANLLERRGARVITTRSDDRFITLDNRAATADRTRADLFVSIHADSARREGASGATVYIARNASSASRKAASAVAAALKRAGIKCRGINGAGFRVLVGHSRPAVLIECGFLTNRGDAQRLNSPAHQAKLAAAIADGIANYFR
ncbi:MAG: N-acetylmuramoyl-L-alanine amidase [bacterium]|nr:N-acetylmuramoyl-L-alanine amidase [bacterium]